MACLAIPFLLSFGKAQDHAPKTINCLQSAHNCAITKNMKITSNLTDQTVLHELGERLARRRIELAKTQMQLAEESGLARRTIQYAEAGRSIQSESLVRLFRALGLFETLDALLPEQQVSPMDLLKLKKKARKRVRAAQVAQEAEDWQWGDES